MVLKNQFILSPELTRNKTHNKWLEREMLFSYFLETLNNNSVISPSSPLNRRKKEHLKSRCSNIMSTRNSWESLVDLLQLATDIWINFQDYEERVEWHERHTAVSNIKPDSHSPTHPRFGHARVCFCLFFLPPYYSSCLLSSFPSPLSLSSKPRK